MALADQHMDKTSDDAGMMKEKSRQMMQNDSYKKADQSKDQTMGQANETRADGTLRPMGQNNAAGNNAATTGDTVRQTEPQSNAQNERAMEGNAPAQTGSVNFIQSQEADQTLASSLMGQSVYTVNDEDIGEVNNLLIGQNGEIQGIVIGVGGFLGLGEKDVVVPMNALQMQPGTEQDENAIRVNISREQLEQAPSFVYNDSDNSVTGTTY
jgi:sporulation protein YlmC with PRC-barrel domain